MKESELERLPCGHTEEVTERATTKQTLYRHGSFVKRFAWVSGETYNGGWFDRHPGLREELCECNFTQGRQDVERAHVEWFTLP